MEPYERLLHAAITGDHQLFARQDSVEETWRIVRPLDDPLEVRSYRRLSWGPAAAGSLIRGHPPGRSRGLPRLTAALPTAPGGDPYRRRVARTGEWLTGRPAADVAADIASQTRSAAGPEGHESSLALLSLSWLGTIVTGHGALRRT